VRKCIALVTVVITLVATAVSAAQNVKAFGGGGGVRAAAPHFVPNPGPTSY
jgi:hypothetical protein